MGRSWQRRPKRGDHAHGRQKHVAYSMRACCPTHSREPHIADCRRHPAMCGDKQAFDHRAEARQAATAVALRSEGLDWRIYRCPECGLWHLTTAPAIEGDIRE